MMQDMRPTQPTMGHPGRVQPIFFYDGEFRTWGQVEQRARLNTAIRKYLSSHPLQRVTPQSG